MLAVTIADRLWWRATAGRHLPRAGAGSFGVVAVATHQLLYLGVVTTVLLGMTNAWVRGDTLFNLTAFVSLDPGNKVLRERVVDWHGLSADALLIVAGAHASAALFHRFVLHDAVLRRVAISSHDR